MITIRIQHAVATPENIAKVQAMADRERLYDPNLNGATIAVKAGDYTCVEGEGATAELMNCTWEILFGEHEDCEDSYPRARW